MDRRPTHFRTDRYSRLEGHAEAVVVDKYRCCGNAHVEVVVVVAGDGQVPHIHNETPVLSKASRMAGLTNADGWFELSHCSRSRTKLYTALVKAPYSTMAI